MRRSDSLFHARTMHIGSLLIWLFTSIIITRSKKFSLKNKKDLGMARHTPPLQKKKKNEETRGNAITYIVYTQPWSHPITLIIHNLQTMIADPLKLGECTGIFSVLHIIDLVRLYMQGKHGHAIYTTKMKTLEDEWYSLMFLTI